MELAERLYRELEVMEQRLLAGLDADGAGPSGEGSSAGISFSALSIE